MGTSNFLYRDTLYALDTYVSPDDCDCDCEHEADYTCEHEDECTYKHEADCCDCDGYHDEFIYDEFIYHDIKESLMADLNGYCKAADPGYTIYGDDGRTNDNRNFEGRIVGRIYKEFTIDAEHASIDFTVGDDFCLRSGYYSGFNFDRVTCTYAAYGTNELENVTEFIYEALFKYDELCLAKAVEDGDLNFLEAEALKEKIYAEVIAEVEAFIAEADRIFHELGEKYFESYRKEVTQDK